MTLDKMRAWYDKEWLVGQDWCCGSDLAQGGILSFASRQQSIWGRCKAHLESDNITQDQSRVGSEAV